MDERNDLHRTFKRVISLRHMCFGYTAWNLAIAAGGAFGGALLATGGTPLLPPSVAALATIAFAIALTARRFAFPPGPRAAFSA